VKGPRRWIGYLALVLVFAAVCALLSWWQFSRNAEAQERIRQVDDNWDASPAALDRLLPSFDAAMDPRETWTPMTLRGTYDVAHQLLVRTRPSPVNGQVGYEVLVPLDLDAGGVLVVDRGWVAADDTDADLADAVPAAPSGEVAVIARIKAGEPGIAGRTAPAGQVATIELPRIAELIGRTTDTYTGAYGLLVSESPAAPTGTLLPRPAPDPGPYLSYAIQWIIFAIAAGFALVWSFFNERRVRRLSAEERRADAARRRAKRLDADSAAEDALLDA